MRKHILSLAIASFSFFLANAQNFHVDEDFNGGSLPTSWTNNAVSGTPIWSFGIDGASIHAGNQNIDGTNFVYFDDDAQGSGSLNNTVELLTPAFDNSTDLVTTLEFDYNLRTFNGISDSMYVDVWDGTSWVRVYSAWSDMCGSYIAAACNGNFPHEVVDISAHANANCQVRFTYHDGDDWGWYVGLDNIEVYSPFPNDIGVTAVIDPVNSCALTAADTMRVQINNFGTLAATNFDVVFDINNGAQTYTETVSASVAPGDSITYTYTATGNFGTVGSYNVKTYTNLTADQNTDNDSTIAVVVNEASHVPTYTDNFEGVDNWTVYGTNPSWARGAPTNTFINTAISGTNAYVTNLSGGYNSNELSHLESPCFDFSQGLGDPIMTFNLYYLTEAGFDSAYLEYSLDQGVTWQHVLASTNPANWYNVGNHWEGSSGGWVFAENVLTGLGGQSSVKLRFTMVSDGSSNLEGIAIDNFSLRYPSPLDVSINRVVNPVQGLCFSGTENVVVELENKGAQTLDSVLMFYRINNGPVVRDTVFDPIIPTELRLFRFSTPTTFAVGTTYDLDVWAVKAGDGFAGNDSALNNSLVGQNIFVANKTFFEDFESFPNGTGSANNWTAVPNAGFNYRWQADDLGTPSFNTGPTMNHTPGGTQYMYTEASVGLGATATLETPCLDYSSANGGRLEFWYHKYGDNNIPPTMGTLFVDIYDGSNWINGVDIIPGETQANAADPYLLRTVDLNALVGGRKIRVRFRASGYQGFQSDMAIDDVSLFEPIPQDAELARIVTPNDDVNACDVTANSPFTVEIGNFGTAIIDTCLVHYQIDNLPIETDTFRGLIPIGGSVNFTFSNGPDLSVRGQTYNIKAWTELIGDSNTDNDTAEAEVTNYTRNSGYIESFDSFFYVDGGCLGPDGDIIGDGWSVSNTAYTWNVQNVPVCAGANGATPSPNTGPAGDHTLGNGKFFYTEADPDVGTVGPGNVASLVSPCVDFTNNSGGTVAFWYHKFGNQMGALNVDIQVNGNWINGIATINGQTQTSINDSWALQAVSISNWAAGNKVQVRFRGIRGLGAQGDMAIDDVEFFEPIQQDARVARMVTPVTECTPDGTVTIEVENFGSTPITAPIPVGVRIGNGGALLDTIPGISPTNPLAVSARVTFTFPVTINLTAPATTFEVKTWTSLPGDTNVFNDTLATPVTNLTRDLSYVEDFESFVDGGCPFGAFNANAGDVLQNGWTQTGTSTNYVWQVQDMAVCNGTPSGGTGPAGDNTTGSGVFMFCESSGGNGTAQIESPCIDFNGKAGAAMEFWYHRFGNQMGNLFVDVFANGVWNNGVFALMGQDQMASNDPWKLATAKFNQFAGQDLIIRFRGIYGGGFQSDMAIDDVSFFAPFGRDARMNAVTGPLAGCAINDSAFVTVEYENFGVLTANPDSLILGMQVDNGPIIWDTVKVPVVSEEVRSHTFSTAVDLSVQGKRYNIKAWTALIGEEDVENDTITGIIHNQTRSTTYFEDFETFRDAACDDILGQVMENGWLGTSTDDYNWHVQGSLCGKNDAVTPSTFTGPDGDHTTGTGMFLYTESDGTGTAIVESPCIDLTANTGAAMSFYYHRYGIQVRPLFVDVLSNGVWVNGAGSVIGGQTQSSAGAQWSHLVVNLNNYVGQQVQIRFRSVKPFGGNRADMAIDDVLFYEPIPEDAGVVRITQPSSDGCGLDSSDVVVRITNFGTTNILPGELYVEYNDNGGPFVRDTIMSAINAGASMNHTFTHPKDIDLSAPGRHYIKARTILAGDTVTQNDFALTEVTNRQPGIPRYFMDFEKHVMGTPAPNYNGDNLRGFSRFPAGGGPGVYMWHVQCGPGPYIDGQPPLPPGPPTGPSGDHTFATNTENGDGCYMLIESDLKQLHATIPPIIPDAWFQLPCGTMDFSNSVNDEILLTYWYHMYGAETGNLFVDVQDSNGNWVNGLDVIRDQQQGDDTERWRQRQVRLDAFAGHPRVRIRMRAENANTGTPGEGRGGDIAVDDIEILDRVDRDAKMFSLLDPETDCDLTATERFRVRVQNVGTQDILQLNLGYEITFYPFDGSAPIISTGTDSTLTTAVPLAFLDFDFQRINMTAPGKYKIKVWTEYPGDPHHFNDTICEWVANSTRPFPHCEDFSDMLHGQIGKDYKDEIFPNDWVGTTSGYAFKANIGPDPFSGHTSGLNDVFLLLEGADGMPGQTGMISSPCFDLTNTRAAILEFWYRITAPNPRLIVRARNAGGQWNPVDTIVHTSPNWRKRRVVLTDYVGDFTEIQFEGLHTGGLDYAIDDLCVIRPRPQQIALNQILAPRPNLCFYSDSTVVRLQVINTGLDNITSFRVVLAVDKGIISNPRGNLQRDTVTINLGNTPPFFTPGDRLTIALDLPNLTVDMSDRTTYFVHAYILLDGDKTPDDNFIQDYQIIHPVPIALPYVVDFESGLEITGLTFQGGFYNWYNVLNGNQFKTGIDQFGLTGPAVDHTLGTDRGHYAVTQAAAGDLGDVAVVTSRCIDLSMTRDPEMRYWYHMFGFEMGNLYLQVNDDNGWVVVDSVQGEQQTTNFRDWISRTVKLTQYKGKFIRYRFVSFRGRGPASNMGLDDIAVYDLAAKDITPISLIEPSADSSYCYSANNPFIVELRNNGSDSIDFRDDTTHITALVFKDNQMDGNFVRIDSLTQTVTENEWMDANGNVFPVPRDSTVAIEFDSTFNMSDTGSVYKFLVFTDMVTDLINSNDRYEIEIKSQRKTGDIVLVEPNDTLCFGTPVTLKVEGNFGAIRWEEKILRTASSGWAIGFFPNDLRKFITTPDTSGYFRSRVCPDLLISEGIDETTDSVYVHVVKPPHARGLSDSKCDIDAPGEIFNLGVQVHPSIDEVWFFDTTQYGGALKRDMNSPFDYTTDPLLLPENDSLADTTYTFYTTTIQYNPNVLEPHGFVRPNGFCSSTGETNFGFNLRPRGTVTATVNRLPEFPADRSASGGITRDTITLRVDTVINPGVDTTFVNVDSVLTFYNLQSKRFSPDRNMELCQDTALLLDAGQFPNRQWIYEWIITLPNGNVVTDSIDSLSQTLIVDASDLILDEMYSYQVVIKTDSGCYDTSNVLGITIRDSCVTSIPAIASANDQFEIYPNPVNEQLTIIHSAAANFKGTIRLMKADGKLIEEYENINFGNLNMQIDMGDLAKGVYIIKLDTEKGTYVEKVIKN